MLNGAARAQVEVEHGCGPDHRAQGLRSHQLRHTCGYQGEGASGHCHVWLGTRLLVGTALTHGLLCIPGVGVPGMFTLPSLPLL